MNSKAIRKQLLAAVAMVLVAAVALGSSTYAWFVASGVVSAKGMSVKAQSEGGLVIRYKGGAWGTTADAGMTSAKSLSPTSTEDLEKWVYAQAEAPSAAAAKIGTFKNVTSQITPTNGQDDVEKPNDYALVKLFQIRAATKENVPKGLYVKSIDVSATNTMSTALRVGLVCTSGNTTTKTIYAPVQFNPTTEAGNLPSSSYYVMLPTDGETFTRSTTACTPVMPGNEATVKIVNGETPIGTTDNNQVTVYVYVWFEGEDHNLYSDNFYADDLSVTINFTSVTGAPSDTPAATKVSLLTTDTVDTSDKYEVKDGDSTTTYYRISGKVALDGYTPLYTKDTTLTETSSVYIISGSVVTDYTSKVEIKTPSST